MRYSARDISLAVLAILTVALAVAFGVGLIADIPTLSEIAIWTLLPSKLLISIFAAPAEELDRHISFGEAVLTKKLWQKYRREWALPFAGMFLGIPLFLQWGLPASGIVGLYLFIFVAQLEDCRTKICHSHMPND
ncbi:hypothetical protein J7394_10085 [Ruegeria sp. R13_0]|uniref:hypothetical protein n=1 Tax=Ruegeria sp. R13_0 TaxID=2821099 RepID=UPI001ADA3D1D|nr:hypothetical protein [Ruegeria sp. R13_0]MBO9434552.1 hypothetical protein [Ruegeria sp. R13_0]